MDWRESVVIVLVINVQLCTGFVFFVGATIDKSSAPKDADIINNVVELSHRNSQWAIVTVCMWAIEAALVNTVVTRSHSNLQYSI